MIILNIAKCSEATYRIFQETVRSEVVEQVYNVFKETEKEGTVTEITFLLRELKYNNNPNDFYKLYEKKGISRLEIDEFVDKMILMEKQSL